jgi:iron complex outermembrane recepter protein
MRNTSHVRRSVRALMLGGTVLVLAAPAYPQGADQGALDEVVVTARKREENLQDIALSITAISAAELERLNVGSVQDVAALDSSLIYERGYGATDNRITIRGLSPTRGRNNVAILVDGIDTSSESIAFGGGSLLATSRLLDLERVEIVKGPHSALYGRSAFAGAIQYVTKDPTDDFSASVRGDVGEYGRQTLSGSLSGPVSDSFGLRFNGTYWSDDGVYRNVVTGNKLGGGDGWGAALTGKWLMGESATVKARLEFTDDTYAQPAQALVRANRIEPRLAAGSTRLDPVTGAPSPTGVRVYAGGLTFRGVGTAPGGDTLVARLSEDPATGGDFPGSERQLVRGSVIATWNFDRGTLTSYTGYTDADFTFKQDSDFDAIPVAGRDTALRSSIFDYDNKTKQFSQELRWQSDLDGRFNYSLGALYWREDAEQVSRSIDLFCLPAVPAGAFGPGSPALPPSCGPNSGTPGLATVDVVPRLAGRETTSISAFGLVEFEFSERWRATAEARYSDEKEDVLGVDCDLPAGPGAFPGAPPTPCADVTFPGQSVTAPSQVIIYDYYFNNGRMRQAPGRPVALSSTDSFLTPRVGLEFKASDDALYYLTVAQGVKPGGISTVTAGGWQDANFDGSYDEFEFRKERITEYELGAKTEWLDGRLRLNGSVFFIDYTDKQVGAQLLVGNTAVGRLLNAGEAEVRGLEVDASWAPTPNWLLYLNYSYLDAEYTDFPFDSASPTDAARFGSCPRTARTGYRLCEINLKGNRLERSPEHSLALLARYSRPLAGLMDGQARWFIEADGQMQGERYEDQWNTRKMDDYELVNLRIGITSPRWDALIYVNNLFDDDTVLSTSSSPGNVEVALVDPFNFTPADTPGAALPDPRIAGIRFTYRFAGN